MSNKAKMVSEVKIKRLFVPLLVNEGRLSSSNMTAGVSCLTSPNKYLFSSTYKI